MATGKEEPISRVQPVPHRHEMTYNFNFESLATRRKFYSFDYNTECSQTPTEWKFELTCQLVEDGSYDINIELERIDQVDKAVNPSFLVSFLNAEGRPVLKPIANDKRGLKSDEILDLMINIERGDFRGLFLVRVAIVIEGCIE